MVWIASNKDFLNTSPKGPLIVIFVSVGVLLFSIACAYACVKLYDEPVRKWLAKKFLTSKAT